MIHKTTLSILLTISLLSLPAIQTNAAVKAGALCTKAGQVKKAKGIEYKCTKTKKKLTWKQIKDAQDNQSAQPAPTPTPAPTSTPKPSEPPTPAPSQAPSSTQTPIEITGASSFKKLSECQLTTNVEGSEHYGFPRPSTVIPTLGEKRAITLFVYFDDLPSNQKQIDEWKNNQIPTFERYVEKMSYGKLKYKVDTFDTFLHIKKSVLSYNLDTAHGTPMKPNANTGGLIKDAADLADPFIDFSKYEFINVVTAPTDKIGFEGATGVRLTYDGKQIQRATFGSIREYVDDPTKKIWFLHEAGHLMGLFHQYKLGTEWGWGMSGFPIWSAMATGVSPMPEFLAWEKFLLGWFSEDQVRCVNGLETQSYTVKINSLSENDSGAKVLMSRINNHQALVVESRRSSELGAMSKAEEGALVYLVDSNIKGNDGAVTPLYAKQSNRDRYLIGTLREGESVSSKGLKVEVLKSELDGDIVRLSKSDN